MLLICLLLPISTRSEQCSEEWTWSIGSYVWVPWIEQELTIKGITATINTQLTDLIEESDSKGLLVLAGGVERGPAGFFFDLIYLKFAFDNNATNDPNITADLGSTTILFLTEARYLLWETCHSNFYVTAGGRYSRYKTTLDLSSGPSLAKTLDWIDPLLGARSVYQFNSGWEFVLRGNVGGFGLGSDFSWEGQASLRYHLCLGCQQLLIAVSYRALDQRYTTGSSDEPSGIDIFQHGPLLGLGLIF